MSEDHKVDYERAVAGSLESRAMALVNPASGLANDFLNVYNEILMLIELLPTMPELADDIAAWRPASYRAYFMQSPLPGSAHALAVYGRLEPSFRALFEASVEKLAECGVGAADSISRAVAVGAGDCDEQISQVCARSAARLRGLLHATELLINHGHLVEGRDPQAIANELFTAA
ncbi:MAG TPA: hypothetical protein PKA55_03575 [Rhodoblastus sp.]|nr:hypothetical protein [Rhodoblastus sp.]